MKFIEQRIDITDLSMVDLEKINLMDVERIERVDGRVVAIVIKNGVEE